MAVRGTAFVSRGKYMRAILSHLSAACKDTAGNVMPIAAAGMVVAIALVGSGVDMSRAYLVQSRLQAACDAGVLAGRRAVVLNGFDEPAQNQAIAYFNTNFNDRQQGTRNTVFAPTTSDNGLTVSGSATTQLDTAVMRVFNFQQFDLSVNCTATMGVGNSDIVMVLDTTGSMTQTLSGKQKIVSLREAMKSFYDTVANETKGSNARIRYGFVPYSSSVNVGKLIYAANPNYLVDRWDYQSRVPIYTTTSSQNQQWGPAVVTYGGSTETGSGPDTRYDPNTEYTSKSTCDNAKNSLNTGATWSDAGDGPIGAPAVTETGGKRVTTTTLTSKMRTKPTYSCVSYKKNNSTRYYIEYYNNIEYSNEYKYETQYPVQAESSEGVFDHWEYRKRDISVATYKTGVATSLVMKNDGTAGTYTWKGCIEERYTDSYSTFYYAPIIGIWPQWALDLNIDKIPTSDDNTKWAPMWPEVAYVRGTREDVWNSKKKEYESVFRMGANNVYTDGQLAGSYCPAEAQLLTTMTKSAFYGYADKLKAEGSTYHDLGMIWGGRLSSPDGIFASNVNDEPNNGGAVSRHIIFMTDGKMEPSNTIQSSYGIEFYDRRITDDGSSQQAARHTARFKAVCEAVKAKGIRVWVIAFGTSLTTDLSECASDESAFTAEDSGSLNAAFQEIAKQVGELRVMQ